MGKRVGWYGLTSRMRNGVSAEVAVIEGSYPFAEIDGSRAPNHRRESDQQAYDDGGIMHLMPHRWGYSLEGTWTRADDLQKPFYEARLDRNYGEARGFSGASGEDGC